MTLPTRGKIAYEYDNLSWPTPTRCTFYETQGGAFAFPSLGVSKRQRLNVDDSVQSEWTYSSQLMPNYNVGTDAAFLSGSDCKRAEYRVTTVDGPRNGDGNRVRTKHYNALYAGGENPSGTASINGWQVTDQGLPFTKSSSHGSGTDKAFLSQETFLCGTSCVMERSTWLRYASEFLSSCDKTQDDTASCFKVNPMVNLRKVIFKDDGNRRVVTRNLGYDGAGHFRTLEHLDNFDGSEGVERRVETGWTATGTTSLTPSATTGYFSPGNPSAYLPAPSASWILGTYDEKSVYEPSSARTYITQFQFDSAGLMKCRRQLKGATRGANDLAVEYQRGNLVGTNAGMVTTEIVAGGDTATLSTSGACPGTGGSATAGSRFALSHTYQYYQLAKTQISGYPTWYEATIDRNTGLPATTTNPQGQATTHTFDRHGRLRTSVPEASIGGTTLDIVYENPAGTNPYITERLYDGGQVVSWHRSTYDSFGRVVKEEKYRPTGLTTTGISRRIHAYDKAGLKRRISTWQNGDSQFDRSLATYFRDHDAFGRAQLIERPDGQLETLKYEGERRLLRTLSVRTALTSSTNVQTRTIKDSLGRVIREWNPEYSTDFQYDPYDNLIRSWRSGVPTDDGGGGTLTQNRYFGYDGRGFLLSERHPETGSGGNGTMIYTRDAFGQMRSLDYGPRDLTYVYDGGGRLTQVKEGTRVWKKWVWAAANGSNGNYQKGKIIEARRLNDPLGNGNSLWDVVETYEYAGSLGQVSKKTTKVHFPNLGTSTPSFVQTQTFDALGNRTSLTLPTCTAAACTGGDDAQAPAHTITTRYNQGLVFDVSSTRGPKGTYTYHPNFQVEKLTYSNGVVGTFTQGTNGMPRPTRLLYEKGTTPIFDTDTLKYDAAGNLYEIGNDRYTYDQAHRLKYATVTQGPGSPWETFTYDDFDNLTWAQQKTATPVEFPVDETTNRYLGGEDDMIYDAFGNLIEIGEGTWQMRWDTFDMQVQFTSTSPITDSLYAYGPGDYRLITLDTETNEITWHLRDLDGTILREYTLTGSSAPEFWSTWTHEKDFIHGPDGLLATSTRTNTRHFFHADHLGTPRAITDASGTLRGRHDYYAFGGEVPRTGQVDEPMVKYTGHQRDAHGLSDYMLGRTCLWPLRRFASVDPARDGWNLYAYVGNNPIKYVDPDGMEVQLPADYSEELTVIQESLEDPELAATLTVEVSESFWGLFKTYTLSNGGADWSSSNNPNAQLLDASIDTEAKIYFEVTNKDLSEFEGAVTWSTNYYCCQQLKIQVNPGQVSNARVPGPDDTKIGVELGWAVMHEFGHAWGNHSDGIYGGPGALAVGASTAPQAVKWENKAREWSSKRRKTIIPKRSRH